MGLDLEYPRVWEIMLLIERKRRRGPLVYDSFEIIGDILHLRGFVVLEDSRLSKFSVGVIYFLSENNNSPLIVHAIRVMNVQ
jgi:hypothetical protein